MMPSKLISAIAIGSAPGGEECIARRQAEHLRRLGVEEETAVFMRPGAAPAAGEIAQPPGRDQHRLAAFLVVDPRVHFLARFPEKPQAPQEWTLPKVEVGRVKVPLARLHDLSADEETMRSFPRR